MKDEDFASVMPTAPSKKLSEAFEGVESNSLASIKLEDPEAQERLKTADLYLRDTTGARLQLSSTQLSQMRSYFVDHRSTEHVTNAELAALNAAGFERLESDVRAATAITQQEIQRVQQTLVACHADTIAKMNMLQNSIERVNNNVCLLAQNVDAINVSLAQFRAEIDEYIQKDVRTNNVQRAETKLIALKQQLEADFGQNKTLRRMASGLLQANDLSVSTDAIISNAEEMCIKTPDYWLAPALVALASWIAASRAMASGTSVTARDVQKYLDSMRSTLAEAYVRDCSKTALFFGLVCRRANNIPQANEWFKEYISFQDPRRVDHTCTVLLNVYAGGLMGHGAEEQDILSTMAGWLDELTADVEGRYAASLVNDWKNTRRSLYALATPTFSAFQALPQFCPEAWPDLSASLQATCLHREMRNFLERELGSKDFDAGDLELVDQMIGQLVTGFDGDELPIRREQEYQQLIVDLKGEERLAQALRGIKDDILSETKSFVSVLSDAARNADLTSATAATHVYALRVQMPWIKQAYLQATQDYRDHTPKAFPLTVGDFQTQITPTGNEDEIVAEFLAHVDRQERAALEATKPGLLKMIALIGGAVIALISLLMIVLHLVDSSWVLLTVLGLVLCGYGAFTGFRTRRKQDEIREEMMRKRLYGTSVIRKVMDELRQWSAEYAANDALMDGVLAEMDSQTALAVDGATSSDAS